MNVRTLVSLVVVTASAVFALTACQKTGQTVKPSATDETPAAATTNPTAAPRPGFPELGSNQFFIDSIPSGLRCYIQVPPNGANLGDMFWTKEGVFHSSSSIGKTPLVLDLKSHWTEEKRAVFYIGVVSPKGTNPNAEDAARFRLGSTLVMSSEEDGDYLIYGVRRGDRKSFIGLAYSSGLSPDAVAALYPRDDRFTFDEEKARQLLAKKGVKDQETDRALSLLRRGGKVALKAKSGEFLFEVYPDNTVRAF